MSATAVGSTQKIFANGDADDRGGMKLRFRWVITGTTPSFTFKTQAYSATEGVR